MTAPRSTGIRPHLAILFSSAALALAAGCPTGPEGPADADGDGYNEYSDCDDNDANVNPSVVEVCDEIDNNCNGEIDEGEAGGATTWYADADGDGFGNLDDTVLACEQPSGYLADVTTDNADCNDDDDTIHPGADEICDGVDNNCDGSIDLDDPIDPSIWYADTDEDGYGDSENTEEACEPTEGFVDNADDCDDTDSEINPDADEECDGADNDCDGDTDEADAVNAPTWYQDLDGDSFGDDAVTEITCNQPSGFVSVGGDCDDAEAAANPGSLEYCDGIDNNCDGAVDEAGAEDEPVWYYDGDGDGYGVHNNQTNVLSCNQPSGYAATDDDCNDSLADVYPGATELCDGFDNNCDNDIDEGCAIDHCLPITADETWLPGIPHTVSCALSVEGPNNPVLTIEDGVEVFFTSDNSRLTVGANDGGSLIVNGNNLGVLFTSSNATPAPGDWSGVHIGAYDTGSTLTGLTVEYAGFQGLGSLWLTSSSPTLDDCTIRESSVHGLYADGNSYPEITNSQFIDNADDGIYLGTNCGLDDSAAPTFTGNTLTGNGGYAMSLAANYAGELDASSTFLGNGEDAVKLGGGYVTQDQTWQAQDVPYLVVGTIYLQDNARPLLTIEDGAEIQFDYSTALYVGYTNYGTLQVNGGGSGVAFTSAAPSPAPGDWYGLYIGSFDEGSELTELGVSYAGGFGYGALWVHGSSPLLDGVSVLDSSTHGFYADSTAFPTIRNSTFADNAEDGIYLSSTSGLDTTASPTFTGNTLTGNGDFPITLAANFTGELDSSSTFTGNGEDVVRLSSDYVTDDQSWQALDAPYLALGTIYIQDNGRPTVTIEDGVTLAFDYNTGLYVGYGTYGTLLVDGTGSGVTFTSWAGSPAAGDWYGLYIGSNDEGSELTGLTLEYAGGNGYGGLWLNGSSPLITDCVVADNTNDGLYAEGSSFPAITDSTFSGNEDDGLYFTSVAGLDDSATPGFTGNTSTGNGAYAMTLPAHYARELDDSSSFTGNTDDRVRMLSDYVTQDSTWQHLDVPFFLTGNVYVQDGTHPALTVEGGTTVMFDYNTGMYIGYGSYGSLVATGSGGNPITFTAGSPYPANGDWMGLYLGSNCDEANVTLLYTTVEYGGANGYGNLWINGCDGSITYSTMQHSSRWGIYIQNGNPTIANITYADNDSGDIYP